MLISKFTSCNADDRIDRHEDLYCKVFIDTNLSYEELFLMIMNFVSGKKESFSYIVADWCDIFVQKNKEYTKEQYLKNTGDFLYWKYYLDMEPVHIEENEYIEKVAGLLKYLRKYCAGVVAACDFEEEI